MLDTESGGDNQTYAHTVIMGDCDDVLALNETTIEEPDSIVSLLAHSGALTLDDDDNLDMKFLPVDMDDVNDETVIEDEEDDDDDYEMNELDSFVGNGTFPTHSKKSDKTRWCEREVSCNRRTYSSVELIRLITAYHITHRQTIQIQILIKIDSFQL